MPKQVEDTHGSLVPPIYLGIVYGFNTLEDAAQAFNKYGCSYAYGRMGNPTVTPFESFITELEGAPPKSAWATTTGLSALDLLVFGLASKKTGRSQRVITSPYIYGGSFHQLVLWRDWHGKEAVFVEDPFDLASWEKAFSGGAAFGLVETPGNPTVDVFDIAGIAKIAHRHDSFLVVDNTVGVALQKPLELGADAVLHSVTKAIIRQSIGLGGVIVGNRSFVDTFSEILDDAQVSLGTIMHPLSAWFAFNNRFTLERDMKLFSENALAVASFLEKHPKVKSVNYPFLPSGRGYELARRQMSGGSGLLSFEMKSFNDAVRLVEGLQEFYLAPHLGDVRYLVIHPASTTHSKLSPEELAGVKITPEIMRMSVGIQPPDEYIDDLDQALRKI